MIYSLKHAEIGGIPTIFIGFLISCLGSLPPGVINLSVLQMSIDRGIMSGAAFSLGAVLIEILAVLLILKIEKSLNIPKKLKYLAEGSKMLLLLILAITCINTALHNSEKQAILWNDYNIHPLFLGMMLRIAIPTLFPFWLGWNTTLRAKKILLNDKQNISYVLGIGLGTFTAHFLYFMGGNNIIKVMGTSHLWIHLLLGSTFLFLFLQQVIGILGIKKLV
jgi:threonine/homoserine/homoserine lactone efflux protein